MTALATIASGPLVMPDFLKTIHSREGLEEVTKDDLILPRLALCQSSNDERKKSKDKYIEGLNDGDFFNSLTRQIYGNTVSVIPLSLSKTRIYFKPPVGSGVILCRSMNSINGGKLHPASCDQCEHSKYVGDAPPVCTKFANFPVLLLGVGEPQLMLYSMKSTALSAAKQWVSRMMAIPGEKPMYSAIYEIKSQEQTKPKGTFFGPVITMTSWITPELFVKAKKQFDELKGVDIVVEDTGHEEEQEERKIPF